MKKIYILLFLIIFVKAIKAEINLKLYQNHNTIEVEKMLKKVVEHKKTKDYKSAFSEIENIISSTKLKVDKSNLFDLRMGLFLEITPKEFLPEDVANDPNGEKKLKFFFENYLSDKNNNIYDLLLAAEVCRNFFFEGHDLAIQYYNKIIQLYPNDELAFYARVILTFSHLQTLSMKLSSLEENKNEIYINKYRFAQVINKKNFKEICLAIINSPYANVLQKIQAYQEYLEVKYGKNQLQSEKILKYYESLICESPIETLINEYCEAIKLNTAINDEDKPTGYKLK